MDSQLLHGWRRAPMADGVVLAAPDGSGRIRVRLRVGPLRSLRAVLAEYLTAPPASGGGVEIDGPAGMTTAEGEYAAIVHERSGVGTESSVQRSLAYIVGDESCATVEGICQTPSRFTQFRLAVQRLAYVHCLGLGTDRWRRYFYDPPRGWSGVARARAVVWLPPDYPRNYVNLRVFDARPARTTSAAVQYRRLFEQLPRQFGERQPPPPVPITNGFGLTGELIVYTGPETATGRMLRIGDAVLADARYVYFMRLTVAEDKIEAELRRFLDVVDTIRPLPIPEPGVDSVVHWTD